METSNFDKNSELTNDFAGVAIYRTKFDNSGILIESANFDKNSDLTNDFAGVAIYRYKYDMFGNLIEYAKFNNNDQLIEGIAVTKYKYNSARQIIEQMYFNESEVLIDGVAIERKAYDLGGNIIEISNYNKMNELTNSNYNSDAAIIRYKYDENNMIIEEAYYDTENNLTISYNLDVAIIRYKYDENNIKIEEAYYDTENNLTNSSTINLGSCAIIRFNQDSLFEEKGFNIYNEQVKSIFYNNQYKLIQETYYKGNSMINDQNGIAKYIYFYDLDGMRIQEDQFDKNQNFVVRIKYTYEGYILSTIEYFDLKNQLSISKEGYSKIDLINKIYFNKKGKVIKPEQLLNSKVTYVKSYGIDINGDTIYLKFFSIKGKPINGEEGYYYYDYINNKYYNYKGKEVFYNIETSVYN